jgi:hypothetical protein
MRIFNFFGKRSDAKPEIPSSFLVDPQVTKVPPFDLFVDNDPPQPAKSQSDEGGTKLSQFLGIDFYTIGVRAGYEYHSEDTIALGKRKICADFRLIIDKIIQEKNEQVLKIKNHIISVGTIHEATTAQLKNTLEDLNSSIDLLNKQKELSNELEGWVMSAIYSYHQGFVQGVSDYFASELLIGSIKNL